MTPRMEHLKGASLGQAPALPANIRLDWKGLPGTNTLDYYKKLLIKAVKSFIVQASGERKFVSDVPETIKF